MNQPERQPWAVNRVIYFSRFENNPSGHGGDKRVAQLCSFLDLFDYEFVSTCTPPVSTPEKLHALLFNPTSFFQAKRAQRYKQRITFAKYYKWSERFRDALLNWHLIAQLYVENLDRRPDLVFVDDPVFLAPVVLYAKANGIPIVAFCHNVETLSREQVVPASQREMFLYELEMLSMCDLVVTISTEETWLLKNFGMEPIYYPYFPITQTEKRYNNVRSRRKESVKANFLLLGTVYNLPTLEGMKRVITTVVENGMIAEDKLIVIGYGTKQLLTGLNSSLVDIRGDVSDEDLDMILAEIKGCIVYQDSGSGALTKIPEMLTAGVPVIINSHAARSHHNLPGIFEFDSFEQFGKLLYNTSIHNQFPQVLSPPDTSILKQRIFNLVEKISHP